MLSVQHCVVKLYQVCSSHALRVKVSPAHESLVLQRLIVKILETLLLLNHKAHRLDVSYVALTSGFLPCLFKSSPWSRNWPCPWGHLFYIDLCRENRRNLSSSFKPQGPRLRYLVCSIVKQSSAKFVQIKPLGPKLTLLHGGHLIFKLGQQSDIRPTWASCFFKLVSLYPVYRKNKSIFQILPYNNICVQDHGYQWFSAILF